MDGKEDTMQGVTQEKVPETQRRHSEVQKSNLVVLPPFLEFKSPQPSIDESKWVWCDEKMIRVTFGVLIWLWFPFQPRILFLKKKLRIENGIRNNFGLKWSNSCFPLLLLFFLFFLSMLAHTVQEKAGSVIKRGFRSWHLDFFFFSIKFYSLFFLKRENPSRKIGVLSVLRNFSCESHSFAPFSFFFSLCLIFL